MEEIGFVKPTEVQQQGLPVLFSGNDCVLHAQVNFFSLEHPLQFDEYAFSLSLISV